MPSTESNQPNSLLALAADVMAERAEKLLAAIGFTVTGRGPLDQLSEPARALKEALLSYSEIRMLMTMREQSAAISEAMDESVPPTLKNT
jgi:hypothetical protein